MKGGIMYEQGDVVLIPFPYSDLSGAKQRPALIISNKGLNQTQDRICCLITSNKPANGIKIENAHIKEGRLMFESWVKPQRLFTIHEKIIMKKICAANNTFHEIILNSLNELIKTEI